MRAAVLALALLLAGTAAAAPPRARPPIPGTWLLAAGGSGHGLHFLMSWTSPLGVGVYVRGFPALNDNRPAVAWTTIIAEYAGEAGLTERVNRWLTVGLGFGRYERTVTTYGADSSLYGIPATLDAVARVDTGPALLAIFDVTPGVPSLAACLCLSPAGSGAAFGLSF